MGVSHGKKFVHEWGAEIVPASAGSGSGIAAALAAAGARVAVNYSSDKTGAERVAQTTIDSGGEAIAIGADVSKAAEVARLFKEVDTAFGRLDVLVNKPGVFRFGALAEITEESFHVHYNVNVLGSILMVQKAIKRFGNAIAPGHTETEGNIAAGTFDGGAGSRLASKTPFGRLGRVKDIAPLAVFLASDESAWITGKVIRAAGGLVVAT